MKPIKSLDEAKQVIENYDGPPEKFILPISNELNDSMGMNMSIITDAILQKGFEPNGFIEEPGYKIYKYKKQE